MENKSHAFLAGLFTIVLLAAIALAVLLFNVDRSVRVPYDLIARTNVNGLFADAAVRYRGLDVGKVESLHFDAAHPGQIVIRAMIDRSAPITHSTFGHLALQGVTGIAFVQLDDTGADPAPLISSERQVARIPLQPGLLDQLQQRGDVLLQQVQKITNAVDDLLSDQNRRQLMATAASIQHAADGVATLSKQIGPATRKLPGTLDQLDQTLASTNHLIVNLNRPDGPLQTNLDKVGDAARQASVALVSLQELSDRVSDETLPRFNGMINDVRVATHSVDRAATTFGNHPNSVLFGAPAEAPGPGEAGFVWPAARAGGAPH